jgi:hypothetical protein
MHPASTKAPSYLAPEYLYSLRGFQTAGGVSSTRMREARKAGIDLPTIAVGKRKYIRGRDAIAYIEQLASIEK